MQRLLPAVAWPALVAMAAGGCATTTPAPEPGPPAGGPLRIVVRLVTPSVDGTAIATAASAAAGRPVQYLAAVGADTHALSLACRNESDCGIALGRLRADTARFAEVRLDGRKRIASPES